MELQQHSGSLRVPEEHTSPVVSTMSQPRRAAACNGSVPKYVESFSSVVMIPTKSLSAHSQSLTWKWKPWALSVEQRRAVNSCIGQVGPARKAHPDASASVTALLTSCLSNLSSTSHSLIHSKQTPLPSSCLLWVRSNGTQCCQHLHCCFVFEQVKGR